MYNKFRLFLLVTLTLVIVIACSPVRKEPLKMERMNYYGNEFNINGFYHWVDTIDLLSPYVHCMYVFYQNGVFFSDCIYSNTSGKDIVFEFLKNEGLIDGSSFGVLRPPNAYKLSFLWGIYQVKNDNIYFEKWVSTPGWSPYKTIDGEFKILAKDIILVDRDTFQFVPLSPKPDSVSCFFPNDLTRKQCRTLIKELEKN